VLVADLFYKTRRPPLFVIKSLKNSAAK